MLPAVPLTGAVTPPIFSILLTREVANRPIFLSTLELPYVFSVITDNTFDVDTAPDALLSVVFVIVSTLP